MKVHEKFIFSKVATFTVNFSWIQILENLSYSADFSGPNQISLITLTKHSGSSEKRFIKIVAVN